MGKIKSLTWIPNNNKPPYIDGFLIVEYHKKQVIKGYMTDKIKIKCDLETAQQKIDKLRKV